MASPQLLIMCLKDSHLQTKDFISQPEQNYKVMHFMSLDQIN